MDQKSIDIKIILSNNCNLNCDYCFVNKKDKTVISKNMILNILDFIKDNPKYNKKHINFDLFGGEPLLQLDLITFCSKEIKKRFNQYSISITTNGTLLTKAIIDKLKQNKIFIAISIDGPEEIFNKMRHYRNGSSCFKKVMRSVELCKANKFPFTISCTLGAHNINNPKRLVNFLSELNAEKISFNNLIGNKTTKGFVTPQHFAKKLAKIYDLILDLNLKEISLINLKSDLIDKNQYYCSACGNRFIFNYDGKIYSCQAGLNNDFFKIGDIYTGFNKNYSVFKDRKISNYKQCTVCKYKYLCRGGCLYSSYLSTKSLMPSKNSCNYYKALYVELNK